MDIGFFIKRVQNIISNPKAEFSKISLEQKSMLVIFLEFVLPFLILYTSACLLSGIIFYEDGLDVVLKKVVFDIFVTLLGIYLATYLINETLPFFKIKQDVKKVFAWVAYALTPLYIVSILSGILPKLSIVFNLFIFYSIYLFWIGTEVLFDMKKEHRQIFLPLILLSVLIIFLFNRILLGSIISL